MRVRWESVQSVCSAGIRWMMSRAKRLRPGPGRDVRRKIQALAKLLATVASSQPASDLQKKNLLVSLRVTYR